MNISANRKFPSNGTGEMSMELIIAQLGAISIFLLTVVVKLSVYGGESRATHSE